MKWLGLALQAIYLSLGAWRNLALPTRPTRARPTFIRCVLESVIHLYAVLIVLTVARAPHKRAKAKNVTRRSIALANCIFIHMYIAPIDSH